MNSVENKSLAKALTLIETLAASPHPLTAVQLSQQLKFPRPTVYRILKTLTRHEFVTREEDRPFFRLSFKVLELGHQVLERTDLFEAARPALRRLSSECRETVHLAIPEEGRMVYLDKREGKGPFCTHSHPGRSVPMHCTALGKAVLAFLPAQRAHVILTTRGMPRFTQRTIASLPVMDRELARVRRMGYAIDDVELEPDVRCVGAPIFDHRGLPVAAISVSAPVSRMSLNRAHTVGSLIRVHTEAVSRAMGWRGRTGSHVGETLAARAVGSVGKAVDPATPVLPSQPSEKSPTERRQALGGR